jgi:hypothetical protein
MEEMRKFDENKQSIVAWVLGISAGFEIALVLFLTVKEIFKKTKDSYILKD